MCNIRLVCGVELELEYNKILVGYIESASYHSDDNRESFGKRWYCEQDGSLECRKWEYDDGGDTTEIISIPFISSDYRKFLKSFENNLYKRVAKHLDISTKIARQRYKMNDLINFNDSMGCHIHIGVLKDNPLKHVSISGRHSAYTFEGERVDINNITTYNVLNRISKALLKKVKKNFTESFFSNWNEHFYREMSKPIEQELDKHDRYTEWNFCNRNRLEFRSFNLLGIKTWKQFYKLFGLAFNTIDAEFSREFKKKTAFSEKTDVDLSDLPIRLYADCNKNLVYAKKKFTNHNFRYNVGCFENI